MHTELKRPTLDSWHHWSYEDHLTYFLSVQAARERLKAAVSVPSLLPDKEFEEFCRPIRERIVALYDSLNPRVSVILPAYNEEVELLPTLISYTRMDIEPGIAELIIVDNASTDKTRRIVECCGAKYIFCKEKGVGHARSTGFKAAAPSAEYIFFSDADVRVVPPLKSKSDIMKKASLLRTALSYMDARDDMIGVSTGAVVESAHWLYLLMHRSAIALGRTRKYSCWSGSNQFIRKSALEAIGGVDVSLNFWEDQHRHYELARLGKRLKMNLRNANMDPALADPVFYSGRRYGKFALVIRHLYETINRSPLSRDQYEYPIHEKDVYHRPVRVN